MVGGRNTYLGHAQAPQKQSWNLFWPGAETSNLDMQPDGWMAYTYATPSAERVEKLLTWLGRPTEQRADFATLYFSEVDTFSHRFGPNAPEVVAAIQRVDHAIGLFLDGLEKRGLMASSDVIVVSDHGMAEVDQSNTIDIKALTAGYQSAKIQWTGPLAGLAIDAAERDSGLERFSTTDKMTCWPKTKIPVRFHFGSHRRIPE